MPDDQVLAHARSTESVLLTMDSDFGELVFNRSHKAPLGIVYLRLGLWTPVEVIGLIEITLSSIEETIGFLTVIERNKIRQRRLP